MRPSALAATPIVAMGGRASSSPGERAQPTGLVQTVPNTSCMTISGARTWFATQYPPVLVTLAAGVAALVVAKLSERGHDNQLGLIFGGSLTVIAILLGALTLLVGALVWVRQSWSGATGTGAISALSTWIVVAGIVCAVLAQADTQDAQMYGGSGAEFSSGPVPGPMGEPGTSDSGAIDPATGMPMGTPAPAGSTPTAPAKKP